MVQLLGGSPQDPLGNRFLKKFKQANSKPRAKVGLLAARPSNSVIMPEPVMAAVVCPVCLNLFSVLHS